MTSDTPMPRGEVVVGGATVTAGYFNNEAKTEEVFKVSTSDCRPDDCNLETACL